MKSLLLQQKGQVHLFCSLAAKRAEAREGTAVLCKVLAAHKAHKVLQLFPLLQRKYTTSSTGAGGVWVLCEFLTS